MADNKTTIRGWPGWHLEPGIGLCKVCDDSAMEDTCRYGAPIPGDECGGCGAQTYECWLKDREG